MLGSSGFVYAVLIGIVPSLVWLFFWTREDDAQPEPKHLLAACFLSGMAVVFLAIPAEKFIQSFVNYQPAMYIAWAIIEEALKLAAIAVIALRSCWNDEPIDAMVYAIAVALGFAALENTFFLIQPLSDGNLLAGVTTGNLRAIGATLVHVVSSAFVGFGFSYTFYRSRIFKSFGWIIGLLAAIVLHSMFNLAIVGANPTETIKVFGWIWLAVVILIVLFEEAKSIRPKDVVLKPTARV